MTVKSALYMHGHVWYLSTYMYNNNIFNKIISQSVCKICLQKQICIYGFYHSKYVKKLSSTSQSLTPRQIYFCQIDLFVLKLPQQFLDQDCVYHSPQKPLSLSSFLNLCLWIFLLSKKTTLIINSYVQQY